MKPEAKKLKYEVSFAGLLCVYAGAVFSNYLLLPTGLDFLSTLYSQQTLNSTVLGFILYEIWRMCMIELKKRQK